MVNGLPRKGRNYEKSSAPPKAGLAAERSRSDDGKGEYLGSIGTIGTNRSLKGNLAIIGIIRKLRAIKIDAHQCLELRRNHGRCGVAPNDPKLSDRGVRLGTCMVGGKAAVEAGAVTHGAVRCSAWLGDVGIRDGINAGVLGLGCVWQGSSRSQAAQERLKRRKLHS